MLFVIILDGISFLDRSLLYLIQFLFLLLILVSSRLGNHRIGRVGMHFCLRFFLNRELFYRIFLVLALEFLKMFLLLFVALVLFFLCLNYNRRRLDILHLLLLL